MYKNKFFSLTGIILVSIYLLATLIVYIYSETCTEMFCGLAAVFPIVPFIFISSAIEILTNFELPFYYWEIIVLQAGIFYAIILGIRNLFNKLRNYLSEIK